MKFNDPICLQETTVRIYPTKKMKNKAMYKMQLQTLFSHATHVMHGGSFLRFATSAARMWSSNFAGLLPKNENITKWERN